MSAAASAIARDLAPEGVLHVAINLGNPVLAAGGPDDPSGVTVDLAHEIAGRLGVQARFECFDAARKAFAALYAGAADLGFLAVEPEREADLAFTAPYVLIEAVYVVPDGSFLRTAADVDGHGVRIGVKRGSAYDLFLTRHLSAAEVVRGDEGVDAFADGGLEAGAGIRQSAATWMAGHPGHHCLEPAFMTIRQAVATTRDRDPTTTDFLRSLVEELKASGFVADSLTRAGHRELRVAPPA